MMIFIIPVAAMYIIGAAVVLLVLVQVLVWMFQCAVNRVADTARGLRLLRQYLIHREAFERWLQSYKKTGS